MVIKLPCGLVSLLASLMVAAHNRPVSPRSDTTGSDSVFITAQSLQSTEPTPANAKVPDKPQYSLPNDVAPGPVMSKALASVNFVAGGHEARFTRIWMQEQCRELAASFTWHAVCKHFQMDDAATADRVFSHVATAYARALGSAKTADLKDTLTWYLPEAVACAAVTALREAYPETLGGLNRRERHDFDAKLRSSLFNTFVIFSSGFGGVRDVRSRDSHASGRTGSPQTSVLAALALSGRGADARAATAGPLAGLASTRRGLPRLRTAEIDWERPTLTSYFGVADDEGQLAAQAAFEQSMREREEAELLALSGGKIDEGSARYSCAVGTLPTLRRTRRDVAACSPLLVRFLELRHDSTGGSARDAPLRLRANRVGCSLVEHRASVREQARVTRGETPTLKQVRLHSARRKEHVADKFDDCMAGFYRTLAGQNITAKVEVAAISREESRATREKAKVRDTANFLVAVRRIEERALTEWQPPVPGD